MTMEKKPRPKELPSVTHKIITGCGNLYVTITTIDDKPFEVFAVLGKTGGCAMAQCEALTRSISLGLRFGIPATEYLGHLKGIRCASTTITDGKQVLSCPDAIGKVMEMFLERNRE